MKIPVKYLHFRPYVQFLVFIITLLLPVLYFYGYTDIRGNFYTWHILGIPLADPLNAVQGLLQGITNGFWPLSTVILGGILSLLIAFFCGRIFCSWLCPYGFLSELVGKFNSNKFVYKSKISTWKWRLIITFVGLVLGLLLGIPLLNQLSSPGLISLAPQEFWRVVLPSLGLVHSGAVGAIVLPPAIEPAVSPIPSMLKMLAFMLSPVILVLCLEIIFKKRIWCSYVCPQALLLMLFAKFGYMSSIPNLHINWQAACCHCKGQSPCATSCSLGLNPRALHKQARDACINCGDCVRACASTNNHQGALSFGTEDKK